MTDIVRPIREAPPASETPDVIELPPPKPRRQGSARRRAKNPRTAFIGLRMPPPQKAAIAAEAERAGLTVTEYILGQRRARAAAAMPPGIDPVLLARILGELGKWGSNWNQLARDRNMTGQEPELDELRLIRRALADMRDGLLQALGQ
jgi:Mobilization protein NikA